MVTILKNYIRHYLKESTVPYSAREIDAKLQSKLSPSKTKKKVSFKRDKVLKTLAEEAGPNTFISFVRRYGPDVPKFSTNPYAEFQTPHGNYAYPLTQKNLIKLSRDFAIDEVNFAIDREFIIVYKITSPNTIVVQKDGSSNYGQLDKKSFKGLKSVADRDFATIARSYYYYMYSFFLQDVSDKEFKSLKKSGSISSLEKGSKIADDAMKKANANLRAFRSSLNRAVEQSDSSTYFADTEYAAAVYIYFDKSKIYIEQMSKQDQSSHIEEAIDAIASSMKKITESRANKFNNRFPESEFHKVYSACYFLSRTYPNIKRQEHFDKDDYDWSKPVPGEVRESGPLFSLLLKEAGIDAVIDRGSSTIHPNEPEQAFVTHFGSKGQRENIELIGTFKNIFNPNQYRFEERKELYNSLYRIFDQNPRLFPKHSDFLRKFDYIPRYGDHKKSDPFQITTGDSASQDEFDKFIEGIQSIGLSAYGSSDDDLIKDSLINVEEDYIEYADNTGVIHFGINVDLQDENFPQHQFVAFKYLNNLVNNFKGLSTFSAPIDIHCSTESSGLMTAGLLNITKFFKSILNSQDFKSFVKNSKSSLKDGFYLNLNIEGDVILEISQEFLNLLKSVNASIAVSLYHEGQSKMTFQILDKECAVSFRDIINYSTFYSGITLDFSKSGMSSEEIDKALEYLSKFELDNDISNIDIIK